MENIMNAIHHSKFLNNAELLSSAALQATRCA